MSRVWWREAWRSFTEACAANKANRSKGFRHPGRSVFSKPKLGLGRVPIPSAVVARMNDEAHLVSPH
jgi:hypothetical protein